MNNSIPIFYACDDAFIKYTVASAHSLIKNASKEYNYRIHILHTGVSEEMKKKMTELGGENIEIVFSDVTQHLRSVSDKLPIRDYYSKTTYYRFFIADMFPEYERAIYIDSDTVIRGDISELYNTDIGDSYVGACHEQAMVQVDTFGTYAEKVVGVSRYNFFNAGVMLINCTAFRQHMIFDKFVKVLKAYNFVVTQDEDYLNLICKDHVYWLDGRWNTEVFGEIPFPVEQAKIIHYIMVNKPWHYYECPHGDIFWKNALDTSVYGELIKELEGYSDESRASDASSAEELLKLAEKETYRDDNYLNRLNRASRAKDRVEILKKIEEYEKNGRFDEDVENDPPSRELLPDEIDYLKKSPIEKLKTKIAYRFARRFVGELIRDKKLIIKEIKGIENFRELKCGAVVTCNHFNAFDSFAIQMAYEASNQPDRTFYRVIREGNYTSFPGFYGFLMRHCNTLPLSSNRKTLNKFMSAVTKLLKDGNFVLIYPEQSMWWNYRKPKPLQKGAYIIAAKASVPVLPCFITMRDSDIMGDDGFYVQEYTIHICPPIYPGENEKYSSRVERMMNENRTAWKNIYETEYSIPLEYSTDK